LRHGGSAGEAVVNRLTGLVGGLLAGAGLMYLFDPDRGERRRALVRDQATSARHRAARTLQARFEDARNRATGTLAEAQQRWRGEDVPDAVLAERVRARLGLVCSDPSAVEVTAHEGCVTLRGVAGRGELAAVVRAAKWTRGVRVVDDQLEVRDGDATAEPVATV
jgi:osmotically-inducible protein OsmY